MLKAPVRQNQTGNKSNPTSNQTPFITVEDLGEREISFTIDAVREVPEANRKFNDVQVRIKAAEKLAKGDEFLMGLKFSDLRYADLYDTLGDDDAKWKGAKLTLFPHYDDWYKKNIIGMRIESAAPASAKKK